MQEQTFSDNLRGAARALASGEKDKIVIPSGVIEMVLAGKSAAKNPASYIRTTMNRVPEVKAVGSIKIKKSYCEDEDSDHYGSDIYTLTIVKGGRKTVYTKADVERIKAQAVSKAVERFLTLSPSLANYTQEEYATVAKVMGEINALVKVNFEVEE
ncbi:hypothetical protein [Escherichia phage vB_EcoS_PHB17]|uniref:Uncharacterized protein n=1 Tax=Escherichia phage vB_EcoS_PHB17 TaxID=2591407 RepID=A0A514DKL9_9CAUD|nr:hypothetical protein KMB84_gp02 [Escherichia phage vB_EcoS_PHB17]QDH94205.1 hypothetical protein [Escherichia phage vB_EcoS_PHB17]